jgi:hypothetical protein
VPIPAKGNKLDPDLLFADRLSKAQALAKLRKRAQDVLGDDLEDVVKQLQKQGLNPSDPDFAKQLPTLLAKLQQNKSDLKLTPEEIDAIKRLLGDSFPDKLPPDFPRPGPLGKVGPPKIDQKGNLPEPGPTPSPDGPPEPVPGPSEDARQVQSTRQLLQLAQRLDGLSGTMNDSPAFRQTMRDLGRMTLTADAHLGDRTLDGQFDRWNRWANQGNNWFNGRRSGFPALDLPKMAALRVPSLNLSVGGVPRMGMPSGTSVAGSPGLGQGLVWAAVLVGIAVLLWKILGRFGPLTPQRSADAWRLGPWPVDPKAVASRAEMIRAFEYLSLLRLGRPALHWNHREIADRLGTEDADRRRAAGEIAGLYERARYAPGDEPLSDEALATFRRDLCFLAGVSAV